MCSKKQDVVYRITETPSWYNIKIEYDGDGEQVAFYQTGDWSEVVNFCETHCNPGYDYVAGLGCTNPELAEATEKYIHGLGKKPDMNRGCKTFAHCVTAFLKELYKVTEY